MTRIARMNSTEGREGNEGQWEKQKAQIYGSARSSFPELKSEGI